MSDKPISPLRQRMIDDMTARRFSETAQKAYVRHVRTFTAFLGRWTRRRARTFAVFSCIWR
jgi:integrase/recombinase XerD